MTKEQANHIIQILKNKGVHFERGLSDEEVLQVEAKFSFYFPPDLKLFLQTALPSSKRFVNWRRGLKSKYESNKIKSRINWPLEGMLFDIQHSSFWLERWGTEPDNYDDKIAIAKLHYETYPKLIPIYSHRYLPSQPNEAGNPVFSVYQMDIIYYGCDLATYLANEFLFTSTGHYELPEFPKKKIVFWSEFAER